MTRFEVDSARSELCVGNACFSCAIGRAGPCSASDKREGDGCTPLGEWTIRAALLRPDCDLLPPAKLPWRWIRPGDGWSDDHRDPAYNRPVRLPHRYSSEALWRDDGLYDAILVLGYNDDPPVAGRGSAIFLHLRGELATEGCVALDRSALGIVLATVTPGDILSIW